MVMLFRSARVRVITVVEGASFTLFEGEGVALTASSASVRSSA